ncbi:MAG: DinB family protein [Anaerolineales bacterium]
MTPGEPMKITLLLDLDDTLLDTNIQEFAPAYFASLSNALAEFVSPEVMLPALTGGTQAMMRNADPALTLRQVFDAHFFPRLGVEREVLQPSIERYYNEVFPSIQRVTRQRPEAIAFVEWAFECGHRVAVATNPFFPIKAIHHRLRWAGLPPERYPFALISSYETFHFTKEAGAYFYEFLGQLGWPDDPLVMVGNDLEMDLLPALKVGLPVFWVRTGRDETHPEIPQGTFADLRAWLETVDPQKLCPSFETPPACLAVLRATPASIASLTADLPAEGWQCQPAPGEWCLTEIVCHLRDVDRDVHLARLRRVLAEENPFLPAEMTDRWVEERDYARQQGGEALEAFVAARKEILDLLEALEPDAWARPARHAIFGPTHLLELVRFIAEHDRSHIQQVFKTR